MAIKVLFIASNYGLWGEELQAPWDAVRKAGFEAVLATYKGLTPLPVVVSVDPTFVDPVQKVPMCPREVVDRVNAILDNGEWDNPIKIADARMEDYDALALIGGPGAPLDITGNPKVHELTLNAYLNGKMVAALCYAVGTLCFVRDPGNNKSIIYGRRVVSHPRAWDFNFDLPYILTRTTPENHGTDLVTPGGVYPLQYMVEDAVGEEGTVIADPKASRSNPCVSWDEPILTGLSVESSAAFGDRMVEILSGR